MDLENILLLMERSFMRESGKKGKEMGRENYFLIMGNYTNFFNDNNKNNNIYVLL